MVRLSKALYLSSPVVSIVSSVVVGAGILLFGRENPSATLACFALGGLGLLYAGVLLMVLYYKMWESIQDGHARTSPGKAIGFLFIPLFNLYWIFQIQWGFSKDYNLYVDRHAIRTRKLSEGLFLAFSILPLTTWIPFLNIVTSVAYWVVLIVIVSQICDAVNALSGAPQGAFPREGVQPSLSSPLTGPLAEGGAARRGMRPLSLYCLSGEFANETLVVPEEGVSIGRDPSRVNLVLASSEISGVHARVSPEAKSTQLWLEDLRSSNGTFYSHSRASGPGEAGWVKLQGKILLSPGARFRLAVNGPEFEIRTL